MVSLCVAAGGLVLGGVPALALGVHVFSGSFGAPCSGSPCGAGQFSEPSGVAVSASTHDVYVVDAGDDRVEQFSSAGAFVGQWDGSAAPSGVFSSPSAIAVDNSGSPLDPSAGDVYVVDTGHRAIDKFNAAGGYEGQLKETTGGAPFGGIDGVAVDASGVVWVYQASGEIDSFGDALVNEYLSKRESPFETHPGFAVDSEDDLYVNRGSGAFAKLNSAGETLIAEVDLQVSTAAAVNLPDNEVFIDNGASVEAFAAGGSSLESFGAGHLTSGSGLAVDPASGTVYVADSAADAVDVFGEVVLPDVTTGAASNVAPTSATLNGAVDPDGVQVSDCHFDYGTSEAYRQSAACEEAVGSGSSEVPVHADLSGLVPNTTYHFRLQASNANGTNLRAHDETFTTAGPPSVGEESASNVTNHTATLGAQIDPDELATTYRFEYGPTASYGTSAPVPDGSAGSGLGSEPVSIEIGGLQAATTYHYRVVATNSQGAVPGPDQTFTTLAPALIEEVSVTDLTAESATLNARIDPLGFETTYRFEWGTSTAYGNSLPVPDANIGSGEQGVAVSQHLTGLQPNTTYHYRVAATNALGTATTGDHTFVYDTSGAGLPDNRAYEMVSPPQKNGGLIEGASSILPPAIAEDGSRAIFSVDQCFAGAGSCTGIRQMQGEPFEFSRTSGGWVTSALAPPATRFDQNTSWAVDVQDGTALYGIPTPPFGEDDLYARQPDGSFVDIGPTSPPADGPLGVSPIGVNSPVATADLSHVVFETGPLWSFDRTSGNTSLYEYVGSGNAQPVLVGVSGGPGSTDLISRCRTGLANQAAGNYGVRGALSADGETVYFIAESCASVRVPTRVFRCRRKRCMHVSVGRGRSGYRRGAPPRSSRALRRMGRGRSSPKAEVCMSMISRTRRGIIWWLSVAGCRGWRRSRRMGRMSISSRRVC